MESFTHIITLSGGPGIIPEPVTLASGETTAGFYVDSGNWNIDVKAYLEDVLVAEANENREITLGTGTVSIQMREPEGFEIFTARFYLGLEDIDIYEPYDIKHLPKGLRVKAPNDPVWQGGGSKYFIGWINHDETPYNFNNPVMENQIIIAGWQDTSHAFSITLTVQEITDGAPVIDSGMVINRAGVSNGTDKFTVSVNENDFDADSINWRIDGKGVNAHLYVSGTGPSFTLDANNPIYGAIGWHSLMLEVEVGGIPYQTNIIFEVVE